MSDTENNEMGNKSTEEKEDPKQESTDKCPNCNPEPICPYRAFLREV